MCPGFSDDLRQVNDARKTAIIDRELAKRNFDIAALQETRLTAIGSLKEKYTFFLQDLGPGEHRIHGVGIAVRNTIIASVKPPFQGTGRIISLLLNTSCGSTHIFSAYAPTLSSSVEVKDVFYEELEEKNPRNPRQREPDLAWRLQRPSWCKPPLLAKLHCKAPGSDGIPTEVVKRDRENPLIGHLHELLLQCWAEGMLHQDLRDAKIITLYKNKGDRRDRNNYRHISFLSIVGKAFARVVLNRLL
ncbi:hypothetical protein ElyMa_003013000 [Elysia marginata]|uniref:Endonuclease/exonuclease/phosphatase domain-containing protein n=1 Tax=Elysia marginata TaxID=1093978 RepID=A0AAV4IG57_9GAST|nr:hypothetical protein ElyMa_003013000 [Elysia marginata]